MNLEQELNHQLEETILEYMSHAGRYNPNLPKVDVFLGAHKTLVDAVYAGKTNISSKHVGAAEPVPLISKFFPHSSTLDCLLVFPYLGVDFATELFVADEDEITSLSTSVMPLGQNLPIKYSVVFKDQVERSFYLKPINVEKRRKIDETYEIIPDDFNRYLVRAIGLELFNLVSGMQHLEFEFREGYQLETHVSGTHLSFDQVPEDDKAQYTTNRAKLLYLTTLMGIHDIFDRNRGELEYSFNESNIITSQGPEYYSTIIDYDCLGQMFDTVVDDRVDSFKNIFGLTDNQFDDFSKKYSSFLRHNYKINYDQVDDLIERLHKVIEPVQILYVEALQTNDPTKFQSAGRFALQIANFTSYVSKNLRLLKEGKYVL